MEILELFKRQLASKEGLTSKNTIKNYVSDVRHFIAWFEATTKSTFEPQSITPDVIFLYQNTMGGILKDGRLDIKTQLSAVSVKRHLSSLRKFFTVLEAENLVRENPFKKIVTEETIEPTDYWHLKSFRDYLQFSKASKITVKSYLSDIQGFARWYEEAILPTLDNPLTSTQGFYLITQEIVEDYRKRLAEIQNAAPRTINRKLSALRRYLEFAGKKGFITPDEIVIESSPRFVSEEILVQPTLALSEMSAASSTHKKTYSKIPPVRLFQKLLIFPYLYLEENTANIIATFLAGKQIVGMSQLPQKLATQVAAKNILRTKSQDISSLLGVRNVEKEFYAPDKISLLGMPIYKRVLHHFRFTRPEWYKRYHNYAFVHYIHFALLIIFASGVGVALYQNLVVQKQSPTFAAATAPPRILSFQGRLTDTLDNPITSPQPVRFMIYSSLSASGAAELWEETRTISPDQDGIFSVLLGSDSAGANASSCGSFPPGSPYNTACLIPSTVFSDNSQIWLGVTIASTSELSPRQKIATVGYATNSEFLQGQPPTTQAGLTSYKSVILALDSSGNFNLNDSAPTDHTFQIGNGSFILKGQTLNLTTNLGSSGNIIINPEGLGKIDLQKPIINNSSTGNLSPGGVEINDKFAILATESAVAAFIINNNTTGGDIFAASSSGTTRFKIANDGTLTDIAYTNAGGLLYTSTTGIIGQTTVGTLSQCLIGGAIPSWGTCGSSYWDLTSNALSPGNDTYDLLVGGHSTASAKFGFINNAGGVPTATISGNLSIAVPTGATGSNLFNIMNGGSLNFQTSGGGNAGLTSRLFIANDGRVGIGTATPIAKIALDVRSINGTGSSASISGKTSYASLIVDNSGLGDLIAASASGVANFVVRNNGDIIVGPDGGGKITAAIIDPYLVQNQKTTGIQSLTFQTLGASTADFVFKNTSTTLSTLTMAGQFQLPITGSTGGIVLGGDTQLFRGAADRIDIAANDSLNFLTGTGGLLTNGVTRIDTSGNGTFNTLVVSGGCTGCVTTANSPFSISAQGAIIPGNTTVDFLIGGVATTSAKFAVLNVASGTPTASVSAQNVLGQALVLGSDGSIQTTRNNSLVIGGGSTGSIQFKPNNNSVSLFLSGANAAVGNQSPQAALDISSSSLISSVVNKIIFGSIGTSMGSLGYDGSANNEIRIGATSNVGLELITNDTVQVYVTSTGNVGIGTISPSAKLDVSGTASVSGAFKLYGTPTIQSTAFQTLTIGGDTTGAIALSPTAGTGLVSLNGKLALGAITSFDNTIDGIQQQGTGDISVLARGDLRFNIDSNNNGNNALRVFTNGNTIEVFRVDDLGNVGIGTSAPVSSLHITRPLSLGANGKALAIFDQIENQDILTASSGGTTKFTIKNDGTASTSAGFTIDGIGALQSTRFQDLTIGGSSTGNIILSPKAGVGQLQFTNFTTAGGLLYTGSSGVLAQTGAGSGTQCLLGGTTPTFGTCGGPFREAFGAIIAANSTEDFLLGGVATTSAKFAVLNIAGGTPTASVSSGLSGTATFFDASGNIQTANKQNLTLGGGNTGSINITPSISTTLGGINIFSALTTGIGHLSSNGTLTSSAVNLASAEVTGVLPFVNGGSPFNQNNTLGTIFQNNTTVDILAGGISTSSAKFAVLGIAGTTVPTASVSAQNVLGQAIVLGGDGSLQSVRNNSLTIGGNSTGNIILSPNNGSGRLQFTNFTTNGGLLYTNATGILAQTGAGGATQCLLGGAGTPTFGSCATGVNTSPFYDIPAQGIVVQANTTEDFLLGGVATTSAKFAVLNVAGGTPTASVSAQNAGGQALVLGSDGSIQAVRNNTLTIGGNTTGSLALAGTSIQLTGTSPIIDLTTGSTLSINTVTNRPITTGTGLTTLGGNLTVAGATITFSNAAPILTTNTNTDLTLTPNGSGNLIFSSDQDTGVKIGASTNTLAPLSVSGGIGSNALAIFNQINTGDILAASASGVSKFVVKNDGTASSSAGFAIDASGGLQTTRFQTLTIGGSSTGNIVIAPKNGAGQLQFTNFTTNGGILYTNATGILAQTGAGSATQCLLGGAGTPTFGSCATGINTSPFYDIAAQGVIVEANTTEDFLLGGVATTSAKFAVLNIAGGTPTASVSSGLSGTAAYFDANGNFATKNKMALTLGGGGTGNITVQGNGTLTIVDPTISLSGTTPTFQTLSNNNLTISAGSGTINLNTVSNGNVTAGSGTFTIGTAGTGTLALNGSALTTTTGTIGLFDANATIINFGRAGSSVINMGGTSGSLNVGNNGSYTIQSLSNQQLNISAGSGLLTLNTLSNGAVTTGNGLTTLGGNLTVNGTTISLAGTSPTISTTGSNGLTITTAGTGNLTLSSDSDSSIFIGNATSPAPLSVSGGIGNNAAFILNQLNSTGNLFSASASGVSKFVIKNDGTASSSAGFTVDGIGNIQSTNNQTLTIGGGSTGNLIIGKAAQTLTLPSFTTNGGLFYTNTSGVLTQTGTGGATQCLLGGAGTPTFGSCSGGTNTSPFYEFQGAIVPGNITEDFILGGVASTSARFIVNGLATGVSPTASISATNGNGIYLSAQNGTIQSIAKNSLSIGGSTTGTVAINPLGLNFTGIGTGSPIASLDVRGAIGLNGGTLAVASISGRTSYAALAVDNLSTVGDLFTASSSSNMQFVIKNNGFVGLATAAPTARLDVNGSASISSALTFRTGAGSIQTTALNTLTIGGNTTGNLIFNPNGNNLIGSGTTVPLASFDIRNSLGAPGGGTMAIASVSGRTSFAALQVDNTLGDLFSASSSGINRFVITQNGNVGIGTNLPNQLLALAGGNFQINATNPSIKGNVNNANLAGAIGVYVQGRYAYVVADDRASNKRLTTIDITNPSTPVITGSLSDNTNLNGVNSIMVSGKYAYMTASTSSQLIIDDISNPTAPIYVSSITNNPRLSQPSSVYVSGKYAYVTASGSASLTVVDVSNASSPVIVGSIQNTNFLKGAQNVFVSGKYAYVTSYTGSGLAVVDVSNPYGPTIAGNITDATNLAGAYQVYVSGKYAYVTVRSTARLVVIDVGNPNAPVVTATLTDATNFGGATSISVAGRYAYITATTTNRLSVVDISTPASPAVVGSITDATTLNQPTYVYISGKYAYVTSFSGNRLTVVDINGADLPAANIGNLASNYINVNENVDIGNNLYVRNALNIGNGGLFSQGGFTFDSATGAANLIQGAPIGNALLTLNYLGNSQNILTASTSGVTKFAVGNDGQVLFGNAAADPSVALGAGSIYYNSVSQSLKFYNGSAWASIGSAGSTSPFNVFQGAIIPANTTYDFLLGSTATTSAQFSVQGIAAGTAPTASVSAVAGANNGNGITLGGDGSIQSLRNNTLLVGGNSTGAIAFKPGNLALGGSLFLSSSGNVGIGNSNPATALHITATGPAIYLANAGQTISTQLFLAPGNDNYLTGSVTGDAGFQFHTATGGFLFGVTSVQLKLTNSGNFGLGTLSSPTGVDATSRFQVYSDLGTAPAASISARNTTAPALLVTKDGGLNHLIVASYSGVTKFYLSNNGDIGLYGQIIAEGADFAEYFAKADQNEVFAAGQLVCLVNGKATKCTTTNTSSRLIGVVSDNALIAGGGNKKNDPKYVLVGLVGQLGVTVSGSVKEGDPLTISSTPGVATVATSEGAIIGYAKENNLDGKLRVASVLQPTFYNPNIALQNNSFFNSLSLTFNNGIYTIFDTLGNSINHIDAFSKLLVANLEVGFAHIKTLAVDTITAGSASLGNATANTFAVAANTITIGGQSLQNIITQTVNTILATNYNLQPNQLVSPIAEVDNLKTNVISPLATGGNVTVKGKLVVQPDVIASDSAAISLIVNGSASISGTLAANSIQTNDATVSGSLTTSNASVSGTLAASDISVNRLTIRDNLSVSTIKADFGIFEQGITSMGPVTANIITATDQLAVGSSFSISNNAINTVATDLEIQSLRQGDIAFEGGLIRMDTDGNMSVNGNFNLLGEIDAVHGVFSGTLTAPALATDLISPVADSDISLTFKDSKLSIHSTKSGTGSAVLSIDNQGNIKSSGSATLAKLNFNLVGKAEATSLSEAIATGSAGFATLRLGQPELTVKNPNITSKSLIYITPFGDTSSKVLYLLRQVPASEVEDGSFTVGLSGGTNHPDIQFNWLIVN